MIAWDPATGRERWRVAGAAAGFNQGGTLTTAGNLVLSDVNNRILAFRADTGEQVLDLTTGLSQMGPPMTFELDGKQYIAVAGAAPAAGGSGGRGGRGGAGGGAAGAGAGRGPGAAAAPAGPPQPGHLMVFTLDGKAEGPKPAAAN